MLPDYEITTEKSTSIFTFMEFILLLIILQATVLMLFGNQAEEKIQLRIVAHSNSAHDQAEKQAIQEKILPFVEKAVANAATDQEIVDNLLAMERSIVEAAQAMTKEHAVSFKRQKIVIPPKNTSLFFQPQSMHDGFLLTIGSGRGDNWWCALFENICFPTREEREEEATSFWIVEWIKSLF